MIPIRDTIPSKNYPIVNSALICINIAVFFIQMSQGPELERFIYTYGLVPARFSVPDISSYFTFTQQLISLLSFMFLQAIIVYSFFIIDSIFSKCHFVPLYKLWTYPNLSDKEKSLNDYAVFNSIASVGHRDSQIPQRTHKSKFSVGLDSAIAIPP